MIWLGPYPLQSKHITCIMIRPRSKQQLIVHIHTRIPPYAYSVYFSQAPQQPWKYQAPFCFKRFHFHFQCDLTNFSLWQIYFCFVVSLQFPRFLNFTRPIVSVSIPSLHRPAFVIAYFRSCVSSWRNSRRYHSVINLPLGGVIMRASDID